MSLTVKNRELLGADLVCFAEREPVPLPTVPDALNALWREASESLKSEQHQALARACLWNLVAFHGNPNRPRGDSGGEAHRIERLLEQVTAIVPARVLHLEEWRGEAAPEPGKEVEAWVSTHCLKAGAGPHMVCCEQVNLAGYGEKGHSHFPALVRALLVPDLPAALLWLDEVPRKGRVLGQLLQLSDRLILDSQHTQDGESLLAARDLQRASPGKVADLCWLRLKPLRYLLAECFDPPERVPQLQHLQEVTVETTEAGRNTGLLLVGWLLSRSGCGAARAEDGTSAPGVTRWRVPRADGKTFPLEMRIRAADTATDGLDGGLDGILRIEILAGGDRFELHDVDAEHMSVTTPDRHLPREPLRESDEAGLVAEALATQLEDPIHAEALAAAAVLVESELWNR